MVIYFYHTSRRRIEKKRKKKSYVLALNGSSLIKELFTTAKSKKSINLSIIVKGIVQLPQTTGPKELFSCPKQQAQREILFSPCKEIKKKKTEKEKTKDYCSLGIGSAGVITIDSFIPITRTKWAFALFGQINQPFALLSKLNREMLLF